MTIQTIRTDLLDQVTGGGNAPLGGNVTQQINTNWGGTQVIHPPTAPLSPLRTEQLQQNPAMRFGPPPYKPRPIRR